MDWSIGLLGDGGPPAVPPGRRSSPGRSRRRPPRRSSTGGERRGLAPIGIARRRGPGPAGGRLAPPARVRRPRRTRCSPRSAPTRSTGCGRRRERRDALGPRLRGPRRGRGRRSCDLPTAREIEALDRLDEAHDDIREALDWATEQGDGAFAVRHDRGARRVLAHPRPPHRGPAPAGGRAGPGAGRPARRTAGGRSAARGCSPPTRATTRSARRTSARRSRSSRQDGDEEAERDRPQLARHQRLRAGRPRTRPRRTSRRA